VSLESEECSKCLKKVSRRITNLPEYIVYTNYKPSPPSSQIVNGEVYELVTQILYMGSGRAGHYTCLRAEEGVTYEFNDSRVTKRPS
jgi:hypothetical protein